MNYSKYRIYFLVETKKRELDSRIYFATKAASLGFSVVIGKKNAIFDRKKDLQKGLIIMKSLGPNNLESIKKYKELGYKIGAIDEEGMMFFSESDYCASRFAQNIAFVDIFFCWGQKEYNAIINKYPEFKDKVFITGNQRIDVLKEGKNKKYYERSKIIKKMEGDFILFATMFTKVNRKYKNKTKDNTVSDNLIKLGWSEKSERVKIMREYESFQKENMKLSIDFIKQFPKNYPNKKLIIRPHPNENVELWREVSKELNNVKVVFDDESTCAWILAAQILITSNCTTTVESFFLNKKAINLISNISKFCQFVPVKLVSQNVENLDELHNTLKTFNPTIGAVEKKEIGKELGKNIFNYSDDSCSAENLLEVLTKNENINKNFKKDKFVNIFYYYYLHSYYLLRFYYRKFFTKQDALLSELITQKLKRLDTKEINEAIKYYAPSLKIKDNSINCNEIYPQIFEIKRKN
jgi:surface carbohydrate biosynthesis protein